MSIAATLPFTGAMDRPRAKRRFRLLFHWGVAVAAALLVAVAWLVLHPAERVLRVERSKITVAPATMAAFHDFIPVRGQIEPLASVVLDVTQGGRVEEVLAEAGQKVVAGQPLIRLSEPSLELEAIARETQIIEQINNQRSLELAFEQTKTSDAKAVADAEYNIKRLQRRFDRRQPLAVTGAETKETLDEAGGELAYQQRLRQIAIDALERDAAVIERSKGLIEQTAARLDANLAAAKTLLDALTVRAPADGLLTALDAHVGEEKNRGQHLGQLDRQNGFKVSMKVDEFYLARVKPGQRVTTTIDRAPRNLLIAKVYPQVKDGVFAIDLAFDDAAPPALKRGQVVQGKLELGSDSQAIVLPAGPFLEASGGAWAFVLDRDGSGAVRRPLKIGRRNAEAVEVLSGLEPGDRVVTSDYTGLDRIDRLAFSS
jgi:HlyD family secretion protein